MDQRSLRLKPLEHKMAPCFIVCFFILASPLTSGAAQPQVVAGLYHTVGLKSDGTVLAIGSNNSGQLNVGSWSDIEQIAAGGSHTVGLKSDVRWWRWAVMNMAS